MLREVALPPRAGVLPRLLALALGVAGAALGCSPDPPEPPDASAQPPSAETADASRSAGAPDPAPARQAGTPAYLGQVYPSGTLWLEPFHDEEGGRGERPWPERVRFVPLDAGVAAEAGVATVVGLRAEVSPPLIEGMLEADSPCAPPGYRPRGGARYAPLQVLDDEAPRPWNRAEHFATSEWYGCGVEAEVAVYAVAEAPASSYRVLAFPADVPFTGPDRTGAGATRPLTAADERHLAEMRVRAADCTLEPRSVEGARELLTFGVRGSPLRYRLSSHVEACTALAERFTLDVLGEGEEPVASHHVLRWRGNP